MNANKIAEVAAQLSAAAGELVTMGALNEAWASLTSEQQDDFTRLVGDRQSCLVAIALDEPSAMLSASNPFSMKIDADNPLVIKYISALVSSLKNIDGDTFYTTAVLNGTDPTRYFCYRQLFYTDEEVAKVRKEYEDALNNMTNLISSK